MDQKICLDTSACISIINKKDPYRYILDKIFYSKVYVTTISVFELFLRKTNTNQIENFIKDFEILNFDNMAARKSSEILKILKNDGIMIEIRDLFIASTAIANNCTLATLNKKHFESIRELKLLEI